MPGATYEIHSEYTSKVSGVGSNAGKPSGQMRFGLLMGDSANADQHPSKWLSECIETARCAAQVGFDSLAVGQHFAAYPKTYPQSIPLLARLSAEVPEMKLITGVLLLPLLPPLEVAEQMATLDVITGGKLIMGVGAGYRPEEFSYFGVNLRDRGPRLLESIALIRKIWAGEEVNFEGRFFQVHGMRSGLRPLHREGPPIWIAGASNAAIRRAALAGEAWYGYTRADLTQMQEQVATYRAELEKCKRAFPVELPFRREVFIHENSRVAWEKGEEAIYPHFKMLDGWGMAKDNNDGRIANSSFPSIAKQRFVIGDPDECFDQLKEYQAAFGACHIVVRIRWPGMSIRDAMSAISLFGDQVIRRFRT